MRMETDPGAQLSEAVSAALFTHHPYGKPIIGWMHEIEALGREDALAFYRRFYTPENAILVVAGDVTPSEVRALAEATYGKIPARPRRPRAGARRSPSPARRAASRWPTRRSSSPRCSAPTWRRPTPPPSPGEAEALDVLIQILGAQSTGRLHRRW